MIDKREMQFLYREGDDYVFMDNETYDQLHVPAGRARRRGQLPQGGRHRGAADVQGRDRRRRAARRRSSSTVTETEPGMQGDRVSGARKPATLETGSSCRSRCS